MTEEILWEWEFLLHTIKVGMGIAVLYDGLRMFRLILPHFSVIISVEDLLFWIYTTAVIFRMQFYQNNGISRGFSILGIMLGMIAYDRLIGERLVRITAKLVGFIKRELTKIGKMFRIKWCKYKKVPLHSRSHYGKKKNQSSEKQTESVRNGSGSDRSCSDDAGSCL